MANVGAHKMRLIADSIKKQAPGMGFALIAFEFGKESMANYISNAPRKDMIKALEETLHRWKNNEDHSTPEEN